ncbi:hypothetical protein [Mycobacterium hubeiense]|uniref:hypothetical protein n=1 Tax=Mycobacterium hubeiense TaxID=1867256 RepID=UPI000C7F0648|nr:hypothetical protein [Mycobacterium sp. QGD 101]
MRARIAVAVAAVGLVAACSSNNEPPQQSPTPDAPTGHGGLAACLAEHGVPAAPSAAGPPPGVDADTWQKAMQACSTLAPGPAG